jgi:hypothetical protein
MPRPFIFALVAGPMPWNLSTQRFDEARSHLRRDDVLPVWLAVIGGQLSQEFVVADPRGSVEAGLGLDLLADPQRDVAGEGNALQVLGHVEIGFVQRQRLNDEGVLGENLADLPADSLVDLETRLHEDQVWTLPFRSNRRHRRPHAELPGFVARSGDDSALLRAADRDGSAAQARIVPLLDRRVEGVHVDVDDLSLRRAADVLL